MGDELPRDFFGGGEGYVYYLECAVSFAGTYLCQNVSNFTC